VDAALWDLKARLLGLPLHRLLGAVRAEVPLYGSGGFTTYDWGRLSEQLTHWAGDQRIPRVKSKIGESWGSHPERDLDRMAQARDAVGSDVELFVDANGGYGRKQAIRMMAAAADLGHIRREAGSAALGHLRRQVGRCPDQNSSSSYGHVTNGVGDTEVGDLDHAVVGEEHVAGLDVPVHDAHRVRGGQRGRDLAANPGDFVRL
jgi:hypothetical protein